MVSIQDSSVSDFITEIQNYRSPKQASKHISDKYIVGVGAGRLVLEAAKDEIIKISANSMGVKQNQTEINIFTHIHPEGKKYLAPITEYDKNSQWVKMKYVQDAKNTHQSFSCEKEKRVNCLLSGYGIKLHEVEVGYYYGNLVAFDYGSAEPFNQLSRQ